MKYYVIVIYTGLIENNEGRLVPREEEKWANHNQFSNY